MSDPVSPAKMSESKPSSSSALQQISSSFRLTPMQRAFELSRPWLLFAIYIFLCRRGWWILAAPAALGCFLSGFVLLHDSMHGALGLSRRANELVIATSGLFLLKSGHGLRATHLRHHTDCLDEDDPEGQVVHWPFWRVVFAGPFHILGMRSKAMKLAPKTVREQLIETALTAALLVFMLVLAIDWRSPAGLLYWAVAAAMSSTMALWAAYAPHLLSSRNVLVRTAATASRAWTPTVNSFAFHHLHHRFPKVPTALLGELAKAVGPEVALADETRHQP